MEREIKFRAWDTKNKRTFNVYGLGKNWCTEDTFDGVDPGNNCFGEEDFPNVVIMQYTGLKDKNGVEIYEGDILLTETDKKMLVGWSCRFASFVLKRNDWAFQHWFGESCNSEETEVIGNIYENPELLNQ